MSEAALWRYVRDKLLPPGIHATRIESPCSPGFPDVHFNFRGSTGTLELKFLRKKKLPFGDDGLNREQIAWHRNAIDNGAHALIVAEVTNEIYVIPGRWYNQFNDAVNLEYMSRLIIIKRKLDPEDVDFFSQLLLRIGV